VSLIHEEERGNLLQAYHRRLTGSDVAAKRDAALSWSIWESSTVTIQPGPAVRSAFDEEDFATVLPRKSANYFVHGAWMEEGQLISDALRLAAFPA
jgi:proline iminopeptidase